MKEGCCRVQITSKGSFSTTSPGRTLYNSGRETISKRLPKKNCPIPLFGEGGDGVMGDSSAAPARIGCMVFSGCCVAGAGGGSEWFKDEGGATGICSDGFRDEIRCEGASTVGVGINASSCRSGSMAICRTCFPKGREILDFAHKTKNLKTTSSTKE